MNTPRPAKPSLHPLMTIAAAAVVLFCGVGSAAIMGWLPSSTASAPLSGQPTTPTPAPQLNQAVQSAAPVQAMQPIQAAPAAVSAAAAVCAHCGVVESVRSVEQRGQGSGLGAAGGALLGGLLGNQVGGGHGRQLATVAGAVGGAVAGNQVEGRINSTQRWEITVRMDNGKRRVLHQSAAPQWRTGDSVKIVNGQLLAA